MKIEIWSDFACPFCYIGKKRFEQALFDFKGKNQVEVIYKAYQLDPNAPKLMKKNAYETFASSHKMTVEEAKKRFDMFTENAKTVDLEFRYDKIQMTNTFDAHRLAKWANTFKKESEITARFMKAYFTEGYNLADHETLSKLAFDVGLNKDDALKIVSSNKFSKEVKDQINESRKVGVQGVPFFVLNRKYGISGAQQVEYFKNALDQIWKEEHPIETLGSQDASLSCDESECGIE